MSARPIVIVGAGKSGLSVARHLARRGERVLLSDKRSDAELAETRRELERMLGDRAALVGWETGGHREATFLSASQIVLSPGVPPLPAVETARRAGVPVTGELELAARAIDAPIVGVTGTNGKSTVTALCGAIAKATTRATFVGGNLGTPLIDAVGSDAGSVDGVCVVEMSSYQLETVERMKPRAAAILNLTPDHLDRYRSMAAYGAAKMNIARRMGTGDVLVVNGDDPGVARALDTWARARFGDEVGGPLRGPMIFRFLRRDDPAGRRLAYCDEHDFVLRLDTGEERYPLSLSYLIGRHNQLNVLAALLLMRASVLVPAGAVRDGLATFRALPHRMELVAERRGVRYYDDSKATNVDSVVAGLDGFPLPFALIAGGRDKGGAYTPLVDALRSASCRAVIAIGEAAPLIERALADSGIPCERAASMADAVALATARVSAGEAVVLSPACSSFDMFQNYEHRGRAFREAAEALR
jgi:UDP-N-acetylmuramoylalanine--D-glutamate ligase